MGDKPEASLAPGQGERQQESCRSQTFGGGQDCLFPCPSLLLEPGNLGSPRWRCHGDAAGGRREDGQLEGPSQPAAPRHWGPSWGSSPRCGRGAEPTPLNLSPHCWPKPPPARHREPAISPHLEVRLLNLTLGSQGWAALMPEPLT